ENPADQHNTAIELSVQQGNAPDIIRLQGTGFDQFYNRGWLADLDEYLTDEVIDRFPDGTFDSAVSGLYRGGSLYGMPLVWGDWTPTRVLLYNTDLFEAAGYSEPPETWDGFDAAIRQITEDGAGSVFGF